jgi:anti-sigma factor RsiW
MTVHVDDVRLHDYLDDELDASGRAALEAHAADCPACARRLAALAEVRTALDALPRAARPRADLWPDIHSRIARSSGVLPLPVAPATELAAAPPTVTGTPAAPSPRAGTGSEEIPRRRARRYAGLAYAAGLVLAFAAGALTWTVAGRARGPEPVSGAVPLAALDERPVRGRLAASATYDQAIADLETLLEQGRDRLDPTTLRTLEASLATIDEAIAEAEAALAADPDSDLIRGMVLGQQRAKYRVLNRAATALLPRS